jgi:hypothetical protein
MLNNLQEKGGGGGVRKGGGGVGRGDGSSFYQQIGLEAKEETSKVLHLKHSFVWC